MKYSTTGRVGSSLLVALLCMASCRTPDTYEVAAARADTATFEINIRTGQCRIRTLKAGQITYERIEDTELSRCLLSPVLVNTNVSAWQLDGELSPPSSRVSPHFAFHGALHNGEWVGSLILSSDLPPQKKHQLAAELLTLWQEEGSMSGTIPFRLNLDDRLK